MKVCERGCWVLIDPAIWLEIIQKSSDGTAVNHLEDSIIYQDDANSRIGIGTPDPQQILQIGDQGGTSVDRQRSIRLSHQCDNYGEYGGIEFLRAHRASEKIGAAITHDRPGTALADSDLVFKTSTSDADATEKMRLTHDGKVGIGTTSPDAKLEVLTTGTQLRLCRTSSVYTDFKIDSSNNFIIKTSDDKSIILQPTNDSFGFFQVLDANGGTPILVVDSINEMVGIKCSPTKHLDVNGDIRVKSGSNYYHDSYQGANGTFVDNNGKTVRVRGGIITI